MEAGLTAKQKKEFFRKQQLDYCHNCAFDGEQCVAMKKRIRPCWGKCTSPTDLTNRYKTIIRYGASKDVRIRMGKELNSCRDRLAKRLRDRRR